MTTINTTYAAEKLAAVNRAPQHLKATVRHDAFWRIASNAELFGSELSTDGSLTDAQATKVEQLLEFEGLL